MTARVLAIMGSGETAPTMVKVHRAVVSRVPAEPAGIVLDTPFGFQMNGDELAARTLTYFADSVGVVLEVAGLRSAQDLHGPAGDAIIARLAATPFVFSGPGSPTYALRNWKGTLVPALLHEKLALGGAVTFSSAAALTLGAFTVPVYEIYKVGEAPRWEPGLDLLQTVDHRLHAAVIPHFDNAEGGTHDTRFCYLGEQRLAQLERELPDDAFVLGVDEHTALVIDLDAGESSVAGLGGVTIRVHGRSSVLPSGSTASITEILNLADDLRRHRVATGRPGDHTTVGTTEPDGVGAGAGAGAGADRASGPRTGDNQSDRGTTTAGTHQPGTRDPAEDSRPAAAGAPGRQGAAMPGAGSPLVRAARTLQEQFRQARAAGDAPAMVAAIADLESELWGWRSDPTQSDEQDRVRATLRSMVTELGEVAREGTRNPAEVVGPYIDLALLLRAAARTDRRFADADAIRDRLGMLGVEVRDTADGASWVLRGGTSTPLPR